MSDPTPTEPLSRWRDDYPECGPAKDVQEWLLHLDLHLTEHDTRHAGMALRSAWPHVKLYLEGMEAKLARIADLLRQASLNRQEVVQNGTCAYLSPRPNGLWVNWHFVEDMERALATSTPSPQKPMLFTDAGAAELDAIEKGMETK